MAVSARVLNSKQAWNLIQGGLVCFFKPTRYPLAQITDQIVTSLVHDLNQLHQAGQWEDMNTTPEPASDFFDNLDDLGPDPVSLKKHPLVLGQGFEKSDIHLHIINELSDRIGGVVMGTINHLEWAEEIEQSHFIRTYRVEAEFGRGSTSGFADGRIVEKSRNPFINLQRVDSILANIQSNYQRDAFRFARVSPRTQEAYELAAQGPIRPQMSSSPLLYHFKCVKMNKALLEFEFSCINESQEFILGLITELGMKLKTNAVVHRIRCIRYGFFTLDHALLAKHANLENTIHHVLAMKRLLDLNAGAQAHFKPNKDLNAKPEGELE
eukprot:maker-scaffold334_size202906-snap-gene-1.37 protein:Tk08977 transcript:maker-scaffold334_size202906-snap-gene-1.37-mRNA-1 annotation:"conserved hypothetical protein"